MFWYYLGWVLLGLVVLAIAIIFYLVVTSKANDIPDDYKEQLKRQGII
jgi:hypothetical protein